MKIDLRHVLIYFVGFGGALLIAYEGFHKTGIPLTLPAFVGLVMTAIGVFAAIMTKAPGQVDSTKDLLNALAGIFQQLAAALPQPATPPPPAAQTPQTPPTVSDAGASILKDTKGGVALDKLLGFFVFLLVAVGIVLAVASTQGCAFFKKDPQFATDVANESKCVADEVNAGDTDAVSIAAKCFNSELKLAYDALAALFDLPSFLGAVAPDRLTALRSSHADLGFQLAAKAKENR